MSMQAVSSWNTVLSLLQEKTSLNWELHCQGMHLRFNLMTSQARKVLPSKIEVGKMSCLTPFWNGSKRKLFVGKQVGREWYCHLHCWYIGTSMVTMRLCQTTFLLFLGHLLDIMFQRSHVIRSAHFEFFSRDILKSHSQRLFGRLFGNLQCHFWSRSGWRVELLAKSISTYADLLGANKARMNSLHSSNVRINEGSMWCTFSLLHQFSSFGIIWTSSEWNGI